MVTLYLNVVPISYQVFQVRGGAHPELALLRVEGVEVEVHLALDLGVGDDVEGEAAALHGVVEGPVARSPSPVLLLQETALMRYHNSLKHWTSTRLGPLLV